MSNNNALKTYINNTIYENNTQQITGAILNTVLNSMVNTLGAGYQFAGVADVSTNPSEPDARIFYIAGAGIYTHFNNIEVPQGKLGFLKWDTSWHLQTIDGLGGGSNLTGYTSVASVSDLPEIGEPTVGYLIGTDLYLYVGEGGDTADGKYQNCGPFRGPTGVSVESVVQTQTSYENGGVNVIRVTLENGSFFEFQIRNGSTSLGLFPSLEALQSEHPNPTVGQYAYVGTGFPADIYICTTEGTWTDSGQDYSGDNVDLTDYATKEEVNQLVNYINGASFELPINLTDYTPYDYVISNQNVWQLQGTTTYQGQCVLVPLGGIQKIKCSTEGGNGIIAFLKNSTMEAQTTPAFSDSYPQRISVINGDPAIEYVVPVDAHYLYVNTRQANGTNLIPRYTIKQIEQSSGAIFFDNIADNLTTDNARRVLSAKQGVVLKGLIDGVNGKADKLTARVGGSLAGKKVSIIGDSISCFGTEAQVRNGEYTTPFFKVLSSDVGQTIQSWVTWLDVYTSIDNTTPTNKTIGGVTLTAAMIGTLQTFTPVLADVGKCIGVPRWAGSYTTKPWWQVLIEQTGMVFCGNASWSGGRVVPIPEGEARHDAFILSEMYSDYTLGRVKGRADDGTDILPDVIVIYRGTNDFSAQDAQGAEDITTPNMLDFTSITDLHNFTQGYIWAILRLRALYPDAVIFLCTLNVFKRVNYSRFPTNNGTYTLPDYNNKIREIANLMGCGVIELDKDGITFENCYPTYINDSATIPTHPNTTGHQVMGMKAVDDVKYYLP